MIDINCFPSVFNQSAKEHKRFAPILKWLTVGNGRLIYGGDKYKAELGAMRRYMGILAELGRKGKLIEVPSAPVNEFAEKLKAKVPDKDFDDEHIVALVAMSRCCVVCTEDKQSIPYLKRRDLYPKGVKPPKIYRSLRHSELCCDVT